MKTENMISSSSFRAVANQFIIQHDGPVVFNVGTKDQFTLNDPVIFQSYNRIIAIKSNNSPILLDINDWDYSPTTSKYRNMFLGETTKETQAKIDSGQYKLVNLNK